MARVTRVPRGTVDFHTHILPGVDHGSRSLSEAVRQWQLLSDAGVAAVVATPHFYAHEERSVEDFLARRNAAAEALLREVGEGGPALYLGAEVLVCRGLAELPDLSRLCIGGGDILLLEMPLGGWSREDLHTVNRLAERGMTPLVAHLDRYPLAALDSLYDSPCYLFQVNVSAVLGCSRRARYFRRMLRHGAVAALGSDLHGVPQAGYRRYARAFCRVGRSLDTVIDHSNELLSLSQPFTLHPQ